ncbi:MAG: dephospho-CoA kinase [Saprospiraceae bacterium]
MIHVGLTGGMGGGKSTVSKLFELLEVPIYNSDIQARIIMENNADVKSRIISLLGEESYIVSKLNRKFIASRIFDSESLRKAINSIVHPEVLIDYEAWSSKFSVPYVIKESALILDTIRFQKVDQIVMVFSPLLLRMKRIQERDNITKHEASQRIAQQRPDKEILEVADYVIVNDEHHPLIPQVLNVHQEFLNFAIEKE